MVVTSHLLEELFRKIQKRKLKELNYHDNPEVYDDIYESELIVDIISHERIIIFTKIINNQKTKIRVDYTYTSYRNELGHFVWTVR